MLLAFICTVLVASYAGIFVLGRMVEARLQNRAAERLRYYRKMEDRRSHRHTGD